jgi:hypothetical protein
MCRQILNRIVLLLLVCPIVLICTAQESAQKFSVLVPSSVGVTVPAEVAANIELLPGSGALPEQVWTVKSNLDTGVVVEFAIAGGFAHQTLANVKVDAGVDVSIPVTAGQASWQVTQATDVSSVSQGDESAVVQIVSDGVGSATVGLVVRFVQSSLDVIPLGSYTTEVCATITTP